MRSLDNSVNSPVAKEIIKKGFIGAADAAYIDANIAEIEANWRKRQKFRTETEMRISVLNDLKFQTQAAKYWQCVREQGVFYENLVTLSFEYRRNKVEQKKIQKSIAKEDDELDRELLEIDLEEKQFQQIGMEQVAKDRMREIRLWDKLMAECVKEDPEFDSENVDTHQLLSYGLRFEGQMKNIGNASPSEMANLVGQYQTTIKHLEAAGIERPQNVKLTAVRDGVK